jgi:nitroreductase
MDLDKAIRGRKSARRFSDKKPDWRDIIECIDSMRHAPMAGGNFSVRAILVDDKERINGISKACQQDFVSQASYVLVVCSLGSRTTNAYGKKGKDFLRQQAGAAMENFLLKIGEKGLETCWVGYFSEEQIKRELKIPESADVEAVFPIGYISKQFKVKPSRKIHIDNVLYFNSYGKKRMNG